MADQPTYVARKGYDAEFADVDVTGDLVVTGAITGAVTGNTAGTHTGNVTGDVTGNVVGQHRHSSQTLTATGAITINSGVVLLNHATVVIAATLDAPAVGDELYIIDSSASGTTAHTVTLTGATFDGSATIATLNAPGEALHIIAISATRWFILENIGSVALS